MGNKNWKFTKERDELYGILSLIVAVNKDYCKYNPVEPDNFSPDWISDNLQEGLEVTRDIPTYKYHEIRDLYDKWVKYCEYQNNWQSGIDEPPSLTLEEEEALQPFLDAQNLLFVRENFGKDLKADDLLKKIKEKHFYPDGRVHPLKLPQVIDLKCKKLNSSPNWYSLNKVNLVIVSGDIWDECEVNLASQKSKSNFEKKFSHIYLKTLDCCYEIHFEQNAELCYKFTNDELALLKNICDDFPQRLKKNELFKIAHERLKI